MIIAVNMHESSVIQLASLSHESNKTLINVKNKGLVGLFNIQAPEHTSKLSFLVEAVKVDLLIELCCSHRDTS